MISSRLVPQTTATWVDHDLRSKETLISTPVIHMNSYPGFLTGMISNNLSSGGANCMMQSKWHRPVLSGQCPSFWRQTHRKSRQPPSVPRHRWIELARIQMFNYIFVVLVHWLYWLYCITEESQTSPGSLKTELNHVVFIDHGLPPSNWITLDHAGSRWITLDHEIYVYRYNRIYVTSHIYDRYLTDTRSHPPCFFPHPCFWIRWRTCVFNFEYFHLNNANLKLADLSIVCSRVARWARFAMVFCRPIASSSWNAWKNLLFNP